MDKKELIAKSDFVITLGTMLSNNKEAYRDSIIESIAKTNAKFVYMHPIDNIDIKLYYTQFIKYEVGSEEGICALLLDAFVKDCDKEVKAYIDDLDLGYISAESSAGEEEFEEVYEASKESSFKTLIVGDDIIEHDRIENIVKLLAVIKKYSDLNIVVLNKDLEQKVNSCENFDLEEIEDLKSYNGTLVYRLIDEEENNILSCSQSFANIAKVQDGNEVFINFAGEKTKRVLKVDDKLNGTVSIAKSLNCESELFKGYRYKQVKIEKVDA